MPSHSLADVRKAFEDEKLAAEFGRTFMAHYAAAAFGILPKTEIDLQIFSFLAAKGVIDIDGPSYRMARALNITPAKARTLLFQHQLRTVSEGDTDHEVMMTITTARYWKDGDKLSFGVSSPLVRAAISAKMEEGGVFADVSLSGNILRVDPARFGEVIDSLISPSQARRILEHLRNKKFVEEPVLRAKIKDLSSELATDLVKKGGEVGLKALVMALGAAIAGGPGAVVAGATLDKMLG
jgi:hypothetical protein